MSTKVGELRESLMDAIEKVKTGKLDANKATAISKLAAQISLSMQVEANIREAGWSKLPQGHIGIGYEQTPVDVAPKVTRLSAPKEDQD